MADPAAQRPLLADPGSSGFQPASKSRTVAVLQGFVR